MGRTANSFRRSSPRFRPQPTVLVICEDAKSNRQYLEEAAIAFRVRIQVEITNCRYTDPLGIVTTAISSQRNYDRVFCVIDRDRHKNFDEALVAAKFSEKIRVLPSYPCFEFWYLLHFDKVTKPYTEEGKNSPADCLIADLRKCEGMGDYEKGSRKSLFEQLALKLPSARVRSAQVLAEALDVGNFNPSTCLHELFDFFEELVALRA